MAGRSTFISVGRTGQPQDPGAVCRECQRQMCLHLPGVLDACIIGSRRLPQTPGRKRDVGIFSGGPLRICPVDWSGM